MKDPFLKKERRLVEKAFAADAHQITLKTLNAIQKEICAPNSTSKSQGAGIKYDSGKPPMALLSSIALEEIAKVLEVGQKKYAAHNWRGGFAWSRPLSAALRHIFAFIGGQDKDPESGLSHLAHAGCCILFLLEFEQTHKELDDRYKGAK